MSVPPSPNSPAKPRDLFGHPAGLTWLFATEMWERFSYFGNAALVVLYMVKYLFQPGHVETVAGYDAVKTALEFMFGPLAPQPFASQLFGFYTGLAYLAPILGGMLADRALGQRRTVILGAMLMAVGHFLMAVEALFFVALLFLILGIGAFKPNISTQVGGLYAAGDRRRDRAYSIFYIGINIGAFLAPLVCGTLAVAYGWHYGFAAAGVGMLISLAIYLYGQRTMPPDVPKRRHASPTDKRLTPAERRIVVALVLICTLVTFFWATYDQQSNTILLWAEDFTDRTVDIGVWRGELAAPWFVALNPLFIFAFTPVIVRLWAWQGWRNREPFAVGKMAFGCVCVACANLLMAAAATYSTGKASPLWLVGYFMFITIGELFLAPVGLALVSRIAPPRLLSMMMGIWLATTFPADILGGWLGGFFSTVPKAHFFLMMAAIAALAGAAIWSLNARLRTMLAASGPLSEKPF
jgi:POT family proton-dependent oligopeptide transporter